MNDRATDGGSAVVCVVEDDKAFAEVITTTLQQEGHEVTVYYSADDYLADLRTNSCPCDLLLADVKLSLIHI